MVLTSLKNEWIRQLRKLQQAKGRREQGSFLVEGTHLVQEALRCQWPLQALGFTPQWAERHPELLLLCPPNLRQQAMSQEVLASLATTQTPDGVIAIAERQLPAFPCHTATLALAVETLQDPGNLGSLIRIGAAAGADAIWITSDSVDSDHPKVLRASAGQWFRLPPQVMPDPTDDFLKQCRQSTLQVLAATMFGSGTTQSLWEADLTQPTLLLLGNEGSGLSSTWIQQADGVVHIPMADGVESLNVGMAGGILLYEARRQRSTLTLDPMVDLKMDPAMADNPDSSHLD